MAVGLVSITALVLGVVGVSQLRIPPHGIGAVKPVPIPDLMYYVISLYRFSSPPVDPPYPAALEVARWLAPLSLILAGLGVVASLFDEQSVKVRVYPYRNHWVICGAGRVGMRVAKTIRDGGRRVVLIDHKPAAADVEQCKRSGVPLLVGNATDRLVLRQARLRRASHLVVVTGDDGVNAEVARQAEDIVGNRAAPLNVHVNVNDEELSEQLKQGVMLTPDEGRPLRVQFFNVKRQAPVALLKTRSDILESHDRRTPSILVIGAGPIGVYFAVEAAKQWKEGKERRSLLITLADDKARRKVAAMESRWKKHFEGNCKLTPLEGDPWDSLFNPLIGGGYNLLHPTAVVICPADDAAGLRLSLLLHKRLAKAVPIVVCMTGRSDNGPLLNLSSAGQGNVKGYPVLDEVCEAWAKCMLGESKATGTCPPPGSSGSSAVSGDGIG